MGSHMLLTGTAVAAPGDGLIRIVAPAAIAIKPGDEIGLSIKPGAANFFDAATGLAFAA